MDDGPFEGRENVALALQVLGNDLDPDGDRIRVVDATSPDGVVSIGSDGALLFQPSSGFAGWTEVTYTITDDQGGMSSAKAIVFIAPTFTPLPVIAVPVSDLPSTEPGQSIEVDGAVVEVSQQITRLWLSEEEHRLGANLGSSVIVDSFGGFSLKFGDAARQRLGEGGTGVAIEALVTDQVLTITLKEIGKADGVGVLDYQVSSADGQRLPGWLDRPVDDLLHGRIPANVEVLDLEVTALLSDGRTISQSVRIWTATGEIASQSMTRSDTIPELDTSWARLGIDDRSIEALGDVLEMAE